MIEVERVCNAPLTVFHIGFDEETESDQTGESKWMISLVCLADAKQSLPKEQ